MAHPEPSHTPAEAGLLARLEAVEGSVQAIQFTHMVRVEAVTNGLGIVHGQVRRMEQELTGFRAEATAQLGALKSDVTDLKGDMVSVKDSLAEILRRLPPPASQQA